MFVIVVAIFFSCLCCNAGKVFAQNPENVDFSQTFSEMFGPSFLNRSSKKTLVYPCGFPVGFTVFSEGVIVVGISDVSTNEGVVSPASVCDIKEGDVLMSIENVLVNSANDISKTINVKENMERALSLELKRDGKLVNSSIVPAKDKNSNSYKLGLWIRDNSAGVGTITYIRQDNGRFGALGHSICDPDVGTVIPVNSGYIYDCKIVGITKAERGTPGELKGVFIKGNSSVGVIDKNSDFGVYGTAGEELKNRLGEPVEVATKEEVVPGKATILCSLGSESVESYEIEIIKTNFQSESKTKSMVIRVVDERLITKTGGIVQGMSGSPILQNGKMVGALTHVYVNDPIKGFAVYAEWMIGR